MTLTGIAALSAIILVCMWGVIGVRHYIQIRSVNVSFKRKIISLLLDTSISSMITGSIVGLLVFAYFSAAYEKPPIPSPPQPPIVIHELER